MGKEGSGEERKRAGVFGGYARGECIVASGLGGDAYVLLANANVY